MLEQPVNDTAPTVLSINELRLNSSIVKSTQSCGDYCTNYQPVPEITRFKSTTVAITCLTLTSKKQQVRVQNFQWLYEMIVINKYVKRTNKIDLI